MLLLIVIIVLFALYSSLILYYHMGWKSVPGFTCNGSVTTTVISIVIAARNEENNIGILLQAIQQQNYPSSLFEVIVVDDGSEDRTADVVNQNPAPNLRLIKMEGHPGNSFKKMALEAGIRVAKGEWIVTTDADCIPKEEWLQTIACCISRKQPVFVAAPVVYENNSSLLQIFQALDFLTLQGITAASVHNRFHSMSNGANLAYSKKTFLDVDGFKGIDHIASGDDMLLMHKIAKKYPTGIFYLKSKKAIISTKPMMTWKEFFNQRIRWASKAGYYDDYRVFLALVVVYLLNLSFLILLVSGFIYSYFWIIAGILWIAKTVVEFPFVLSVATFFEKKKLMRYFFFFQPLHIFYTIVAGLLGQLGSYEWKGRTVK